MKRYLGRAWFVSLIGESSGGGRVDIGPFTREITVSSDIDGAFGAEESDEDACRFCRIGMRNALYNDDDGDMLVALEKAFGRLVHGTRFFIYMIEEEKYYNARLEGNGVKVLKTWSLSVNKISAYT